MLLFSFCVSSHIWQLPGNNWQSINWKLNQIDFKEQPLSSGLKYNLVEYRCKIQNADNYFEHETYLSWHDGPSLMVAYHIQNCDIKVFLIYLASWDAIEPGSLSDSKNWLDWCDPGEWRYLLKTLLKRPWRLMILIGDNVRGGDWGDGHGGWQGGRWGDRHGGDQDGGGGT